MNDLISGFGNISEQGFVPAQADTEGQGRTVLSQFALLAVDGPDSERFLQGQLTCDMSEVTLTEWRPGACCTARGQMIANFIVLKSATGYLLRLPSAQVQPLMDHLKKYAVFFKAEMKTAEHLLLIGELPTGTSDSQSPATHTVSPTVSTPTINWPDGRAEYWADESQARELLTNSLLTSEAEWSRADIASGWLWLLPESADQWAPQYIDWQQHEGISFSKGCYTGQEIIARLQYRSKSKRHLFSVESDHPLPSVMTPIALNGRDKGEIGSIGLGSFQNSGLAVMNAEAQEIQGECDGHPVTLRRLFYTEE